MALDTPTLKALIRLQSTAEGLLDAAGKAAGNHEKQAVRDRLGLLANEIAEVLRGADAQLAEELARVFDPRPEEHTRHSVQADAAALAGWLRGVIAAETQEVRMKVEAEAYAAARIKEERGVGFGSS